jgi:hypothetical protein
MYLMCANMVIRNEIAQGLRQKDIAMTWAMALHSQFQGDIDVDWADIKAAIREKWGDKAVNRIGKQGWALYESRFYPR